MIDQYGRSIRYLRVSVTDRCNLRCIYCMPEYGIKWADSENLLTDKEILRIIRVLARHGINKVRFTGGEPLIREDLAEIIWETKHTPGIEMVTLTTNGVLLAERLPDLIRAGLDGINISLDSLDRTQYANITKRDLLPQVINGLEAASGVPSLQVKINCVLMGQRNNDVISLAEIAKDCNLSVRFIELMPIGRGEQFRLYTEGEILSMLEARFGPSRPLSMHDNNAGPAKYVTFSGFCGRVGFISAMTHPFCMNCNRIRLMATGELKTCLQYQAGVNLKQLLMDASINDLSLERIMCTAVLQKPLGHHFRDHMCRKDENRHMYQIGG